MKAKLIPCSTASLLLSSAALAAETPSAELQVTGTVAPESCIVAMANDGVLDFGALNAGLVRPNADTLLTDTRTETLTITCPASTTLAYRVTENRAGTASVGGTAITNFGLGNINTTGRIGRYNATVKNAKVGTTDAFISARTGTTGNFGSGALTFQLLSGSPRQYTWSNSRGTPQAGLVFSTDVEISLWLASARAMNGVVTDSVPLDGSFTLVFTTGL